MTDIEQKALELVNEVRAEYGYTVPITYDWFNANSFEHLAFLRAIEQHEAFAQEVSDAVEQWSAGHGDDEQVYKNLTRFIIAKPDPLDEAVKEAASKWMNAQEPLTDGVRAAIEKRGGKIVWGEG